MSAGTESRDIGRLRVCCFPHRMAENAFLSLLYEPLEARGARSIPIERAPCRERGSVPF